MKKSVCILFGGKSEEYEVSLSSAYNVLGSIDKSKYNVSKIGITKDGRWLRYYGGRDSILNDTWRNEAKEIFIDFSTGCVDNLPFDTVFFPVMHGNFCEDGRLQGIFESIGARYIGCHSASSFLCMDKHLTKMVARSLKIPVVDWICISKHQAFNKIAHDVSKFGYPVFVKPSKSGSSNGSFVVYNESMLFSAIQNAFEYSDTVLIEKYIKAIECEIGMLTTEAITIFSEVGSLKYSGDFYGYKEKYLLGSTTYSIPALISAKNQEKIKEYAKSLFSALGCYGLSRFDFFVDENESIYFNEVNTLPGFTRDSMYPMLFEKMGYSLTTLIDILIENAKI